jgi:hypothetical protein
MALLTFSFQQLDFRLDLLSSAEAAGLRTWTWEFDEAPMRPAVEAVIGFAFMLGAAVNLLIRRRTPDASSLHIAFVGDCPHR